MSKRFPFRRSVGLSQSMADRVERVAREQWWSYEHTMRVLLAEALRSRESSRGESLSAPGAQSDSNRPAQMSHSLGDKSGPGNGDLVS